ncbi:MAG: hypothetical protein U0930_26505 [Pirellulales bacterium]
MSCIEDHRRFEILGGGNDDLGPSDLIEDGTRMQLTASSNSAPYFSAVVVLVFFVAFISFGTYAGPGYGMNLFTATLFFSPFLIYTLAMVMFASWYIHRKESRILPLLTFDGQTLVCIRGKEVRVDCGNLELYLVHAFNSWHGEVVEVQIHGSSLESGRSLVVSMLPGSQYEMKKLVSRIGETKGMNTYFVKTNGPQRKLPFIVKSKMQLTAKPDSKVYQEN